MLVLKHLQYFLHHMKDIMENANEAQGRLFKDLANEV